MSEEGPKKLLCVRRYGHVGTTIEDQPVRRFDAAKRVRKAMVSVGKVAFAVSKKTGFDLAHRQDMMSAFGLSSLMYNVCVWPGGPELDRKVATGVCENNVGPTQSEKHLIA